MTTIFTDRPLEEYLKFKNVRYEWSERVLIIAEYGGLTFRRRDELLDANRRDGTELEWLFGRRFKRIYAYDLPLDSRESHCLYGHLYLFICHYLKWGDNIAIYDQHGISWLGMDVAVAKIDISSKPIGNALLYDTQHPRRDVLFRFFDSKNTARKRDTSIMKLFDKDLVKKSKPGCIPYMDGDGRMTVSGLIKACGNSMSLILVYDHVKVEEMIQKYDGMKRSKDNIAKEDYVKPLEVIRFGGKSVKGTEGDDVRTDGRSRYGDWIIARFGFGCLSDLIDNGVTMMIDQPSVNKEDMTMIMMIEP